jgi:hypothetical protein
MSDHFQMLVDVDATPDQADEIIQLVLARFRSLGLITGDATPDCVLGGEGFRPGPAIPDLYQVVGKNDYRFWRAQISGVETKAGRSFNEWALGPSCNGFACPNCQASIEAFDDTFTDSFFSGIGEWFEQTGEGLVECPQCRKALPVTSWECSPPLGFGNARFFFWNWPPFDYPAWKIDVVKVVQEVTGHEIVKTHGHI